MRKIIFLLILLFPTFAFGQNYAGNYRAVFINFLSEPRTVTADFEVKTDNSIACKIIIDSDVKVLNGTVDKKGKFEAVSQIEGNIVYKLKGKFDKDNKISYIQRIENRSAGNKGVSENGMEGTFSKVSAPIVKEDFPIKDNGKTQLWFRHPNPSFDKEWLDFPATVKLTNYSGLKELEVKMELDMPETFRSFSFRMLPPKNGQKVWNGNDLTDFDYGENNKGKSNVFLGQEQDLLQGKVEIIGENEKQMIFKITNLQIKSARNELLQVDGYIYANKIDPTK